MSILDRARAKAQAEAEERELYEAMQGRALAEAAMRNRMAQRAPMDITPRSPGLAERAYEMDDMEVRQSMGGRLNAPRQFR